MKTVTFLFFSLCVVVLSFSTTSCKKKNKFSKGNLSFSTDTLVFDTVFTTIGSTTQKFKVYNSDNKTLKIDEIELVGGSSSPFKINFDGIQGTKITDIEIEKNDSLYCFVEVTLNVNSQSLPMIVEDSIRFRSNGVDQYVKLAVWGQDAYFHYRDVNEGTWANDKPHVVYGYAGIDSAKTLTIPAGTDIFLHKNSIIYVYKSTLNIEGELGNEVTLQGDRLESFYDDVPGQYYGIYFEKARPSTIKHTKIRNGIAGIHVFSRDEAFSAPTVTLFNTEIWNCSNYGVFLYDAPKFLAENTLIHSNSIHALLVLQGAEFTFNQCDLLGYGGGDGTTPAVGLRNYFNQNGTTFVGQVPVGDFNNCVIYGAGTDELVFDTLNPGGVTLNFNFRNCLLKHASSTHPFYTNTLFGVSPVFINPFGDNFKFSSSSSGLYNNGDPAFQTAYDFLGIPWDLPSGNPPDIGVYSAL